MLKIWIYVYIALVVVCHKCELSLVVTRSERPLNLPPDTMHTGDSGVLGSSSFDTENSFPDDRSAPTLDTPDVYQTSYTDTSDFSQLDVAELPEMGSNTYDDEISADGQTAENADGASHQKRDIEAGSSNNQDSPNLHVIEGSYDGHGNNDTGDVLFDRIHGDNSQNIQQHEYGFPATSTAHGPEHRPFLLDSSMDKISRPLPSLNTRTTPSTNASLEHDVDHINIDEGGLPGNVEHRDTTNEEHSSNTNTKEQTINLMQTTEESIPGVHENNNDLGHIAYLPNAEYENSHQSHGETGDSHAGVDVPLDKGGLATPAAENTRRSTGHYVNTSNPRTATYPTNKLSEAPGNRTTEKIAILPTPSSTETSESVEPSEGHINLPVAEHGNGNIAIIDGNSEENSGHGGSHDGEGHETGIHEHPGEGHLVPGEGHIESHTSISELGGGHKPEKGGEKEWDIKTSPRSNVNSATTEASFTLHVLEPSRDIITPTFSRIRADSSSTESQTSSVFSDYDYESEWHPTPVPSGDRSSGIVTGTSSDTTQGIVTSTITPLSSYIYTNMVHPTPSEQLSHATLPTTNSLSLYSTVISSEPTEQTSDSLQSSEVKPSLPISVRSSIHTYSSEINSQTPESTQYLESSDTTSEHIASLSRVLHYTTTSFTSSTVVHTSSSGYSSELTGTLFSRRVSSSISTFSTFPLSNIPSVSSQEPQSIIATHSPAISVTKTTYTTNQNTESQFNVTFFVTTSFITLNGSTHHSVKPVPEETSTTSSTSSRSPTSIPRVTQPSQRNTTIRTTIFTIAANSSRRTLKPVSRVSLPPQLTNLTRLTTDTDSISGTTTSRPNASVISGMAGNQSAPNAPTTAFSTTKKTGTTKGKNEPSAGRFTAMPAHRTTASLEVSTAPPVFIQISIRMSWRQFCSAKTNFISTLSEILHVKKQVLVDFEQIKIPNLPAEYCPDDLNPLFLDGEATGEITVEMYIVDRDGKVDITLTVDASSVIEKGFRDSTSFFRDKIVTVTLQRPHINHPGPDVNKNSKTPNGVTMVIIIASVGGICCVMLVILQVVLLHRRVKAKKTRFFVSHRPSIRSLDHVALGSIPKSRPGSGYWNPGLTDTAELPEIAEFSHTMSYSALANFCMDESAIQAEFQTLSAPMLFQSISADTPDSSCVPVGEEDKNRFANVLPHKHTRVKLQTDAVNSSDYINANYVNGYMGERHVYIATQSPLVNTANDFWRMVWQEQSRVILTLNPLGPNGKPKQSTCYWPDSLDTDQRREFGEFVVTLKKRDEQRDYVDCTLEILDIERNLKRQVHHFQLTCWPDTRPPEPLSLVKFVLDTRPHYENSRKPVIIHCGPGTGRTCTLIALDVCMRMFEDQRRVDVLSCVHILRAERAGAVQTNEQYLLLYQALNEYAVILNSPSVSTRSSVITLHAML